MDSKAAFVYGTLTLNILALVVNPTIVAADIHVDWLKPIPATHTTSAGASLFYILLRNGGIYTADDDDGYLQRKVW